MRFSICITAVLAVTCAAIGANGAEPLSVYTSASLGQNFMGGFDYLPDGEIIGMYTDPNMAENAYIGIIDANGDGSHAGVRRVHEFGYPTFGIAVKVSPDGSRVLFGDSFTFKIYSMNLSAYQDVQEIVPTGGTFKNAYDIAFIDAEHCYVSANPGEYTGPNKILHLDLTSNTLTELVSVNGTYAGPVDTDVEGNLYYVKGKANFPVQPGDFTLLKFTAAKLQSTLSGSPVLGETDAEVIVAGLDGGQDVSWHSSGTLWVSDANNSAVYEVAPGGAVSDYAVMPGNSGEGFWFLSVFGRELSSGFRVAATYQPLPGKNQPDLYLVTPPYAAGQRLVLTAVAQPTSVASDAYVVFLGPGGIAYSVTPKGLREGIQAYARKLPPLQGEVVARVVDLTIPEGVRAGVWTVCVALMPQGTKPSVAKALALDSSEITLE